MPVAAIIAAAVVGAGASIYSSNKAADAQKKAAAQGNALQQQQYEQTRTDLAPYRDAGSSALSRYRDLLGFNGGDAANTALQGYTQSPFLPQLVKDSTNAVENSRAARGSLFSGGALGEIGQKASNLYLGDYNNYLSRIGGMADMGQSASAQTGTFGANSAANQAGALQNAGNAQAGAYINTGNSINNFLSQAAGTYGAYKGGAFKDHSYDQYLNQDARSIFG
jgi:hypothetical protein